ncbi:MAG TPA: hypothetical protein VKR61_09880 [Bryobacteraceae bacterium]|nr:hypothetical protein [Bryobacteraceae bacterium]
MSRRVWLPALGALTVLAGYGQEAVVVRARPGALTVGPFARPPIAGAPYSAEELTETVQTLADGTHITHKSTVKLYRDSEGRTRTERSPLIPGPDGADAPIMIDIIDPVAHVHYLLNAREKLAHKQTIAEPGNRPTLRRVPAARKVSQAREAGRPETKTEQLGTDTMEGLLVEGTRSTTTWPAGSMIGNDQPVSSVNETWVSPELKVTVLAKNSDPRTGEHTQKLVNISRAEPEPGLFQPPADYTVTEMEPPVPR